MRLQMIGLSLFAAITLCACIGDDDSPAPDGRGGSGGDSGTGGDGGGGDGGGGSGGTGGGTECDLPALQVTEPAANTLSNLSVGSDALVFISSEPTTLFGTIDAVGFDGEGRQTLHSPTGQRRVRSVIADGETVYFLEENEDIVSAFELFSVPITGGTAERVGEAAIGDGYIFGLDATHLYLLDDSATLSSVVRIHKSTGAKETIGRAAGEGATYGHVQLAGDHIYFWAGTPATVYALDKTATDTDATLLWAAGSPDRCGFPLGGLFASDDKLVCGYFSLAARDLDGMNETVLFAGMVLDGAKIPLAADGASFYYGGPNQGAALLRMTNTGEDITEVVCNTGVIANQLVDAFFPIQFEYEVAVGESDIFWIETRMVDGGYEHLIRRAAK